MRLSRLALLAVVVVGGLIILTASPAAASTALSTNRPQTDLYVSPSGSDHNQGSRSRPFKTLERAQQAVRDLNTHMRADITVNLAGGTYELSHALTLTAADSGTNGHQVIWRAEPGQTPVISGGKQVFGWHQVDSAHNIWEAAVPADLTSRQLYVNGTRATRAVSTALPAGSAATSTGFTVPGDALQAVRNPAHLEFVFHTLNWAQQRCDAAAISGTATQTLITMKQPCWNTIHLSTVGGGSAGLPTYIENDYSFLDQPGEWYLDQASHRVYYIPRTGENLRTASVIAPDVQNLVIGAGTAGAPLHDMTFQGITFAYSTWLQPSGNDGFPEIQADLTLAPLGGPNWEGTDGTPSGTGAFGGQAQMMPDAVELHSARHIQLIRNTFTHLGAAGLGLDQGSQHNTVSGNVFTDISGNGLQVGTVANPTQADPNLVDSDNTVTNNYVHNVAAEYQGGVGMFFGYVHNTLIAHNEVADLPYSGISLGWGWGYPSTVPTSQGGNRVEDNYIHDIMKLLVDGAAVYSLGSQPGSVISGNYVKNQNNLFGSLYLDQGSTGWAVDDNVVEHVAMWFLNNPNAWDASDLTVSDNYTDTAAESNGHATVSGTTFITAAALPASIIANAGLERRYRDIHRTTPPSDSRAPATPSAPAVSIPTPTSVQLTWQAPRDNVGVTGYEVYVDGRLEGVTAVPTFAVTGLSTSHDYTFSIAARDAAVNLSMQSRGARVHMPPPDTEAPAVPHAPTASAQYPSEVDLSWPATTDNWAVTDYLVYRDGVEVQKTTSTSATIPGETRAQTYQFTVRAEDAAGNLSEPSPPTSITTPDLANLALHAAASALFIDGRPAVMQPKSVAANAVDGDPSTAAQASDQYAWQLQVDLSSSHSISAVITQMPSTAYATDFDIAISTDGQNWTVAKSVTGAAAGVNIEAFAQPLNARYIRIVAIKPNGPGQTGGQMSISELEVYGA